MGTGTTDIGGKGFKGAQGTLASLMQVFPVSRGAVGGGGVFAIFCGFMVIQLIWVMVFMPETKGIPLAGSSETTIHRLGLEGIICCL